MTENRPSQRKIEPAPTGGDPAAPPAPDPGRDRVAIAAAALLAMAAGAAQAWMLRGLQRLPSPLFGGDLNYQSGCIRSILATGDPMASCSCSGALPGYLPLYGTVAAVVSRVTGLPVVNTMFLLSVLLHAASVLAVARVVGRHVSPGAGIVTAALWAVVQQGPALHYTEFTELLVVPIFFDALLRWLDEPRAPRAVYLGLTLGALGYSHAVAFIGAVMVTGLCAVARLVLHMRDDGPAAAARTSAIGLAIAGAGAALALGYWFRPIFVYHGHTSLHYAEWNGGPILVTFMDRLRFLGGWMARPFKFEGWSVVVLDLLFVAGAIALIPKATRLRFTPIVVAALATLAWMLHFFVTMPLLRTHFVPDYVRRMLGASVVVLVAGVPVTLALERLTRQTRAVAMFVAVAAACGALFVGATSAADHEDMADAREPQPPQFESLATWAAANTRPIDVLLSTNELSFAWAALTGRKTLVSRRAQNDAFLDLDQRNADAAVILYGRDDALRRERLAHWQVRWLLWSTDWADGEFVERGGLRIATIDPLGWFSDAARDSAVSLAGVQLEHEHTWVDPALQSPDIPRFDLTRVAPANYTRPERPWSPALDTLLEEAWHHDEDGHRMATLYRVRMR